MIHSSSLTVLRNEERMVTFGLREEKRIVTLGSQRCEMCRSDKHSVAGLELRVENNPCFVTVPYSLIPLTFDLYVG